MVGTAAWMILLSYLAACSTLHGVPTRYAPAADIVTKINLTPDELATLPTVKDEVTRNTVINKTLVVIDVNFHEFVRRVNGDRQDIGAAGSATALGLNLAGTLVDSVAAKTNYAAFAAATVGAIGILDKNYFFEKTIPALVAAMEAARQTVLLRIKTGETKPVEEYDGQTAFSDLEEYFSAGTILGAVNTITTRADTEKADTSAAIRKLEVPTDDDIKQRKRVRDAIFKIDDASLAKGRAALKALGLPDHSTAAEVRLELLRSLRKAPVDKSVDTTETALRSAGLVN
jgi:hypothetical protein